MKFKELLEGTKEVSKANKAFMKIDKALSIEVDVNEVTQAGNLLDELSDAIDACESRMKKDGYNKEREAFTKVANKAWKIYNNYDEKENGKEY